MSSLIQEAEEASTEEDTKVEEDSPARAWTLTASHTRSYSITEHQSYDATSWVKAITRNVIVLPPEFPNAVDEKLKMYYSTLVDEGLVDKFVDICASMYAEKYLERLSDPSTWSVEGMAALARSLGSADIWKPEQQRMVYQWSFWYESSEKYSTYGQRVFLIGQYTGETCGPKQRCIEYLPFLKPEKYTSSTFGKARLVVREGVKFEKKTAVRVACLDDIPDNQRQLRALVSRTIKTTSSIMTPTYRLSGSGNWHSNEALAYAKACREGIPGLPSGDFIMPLNAMLPASHPMRIPWTKRAVAILQKTWNEAGAGDHPFPGIDRIIQQRLLPEKLSLASIRGKRRGEGLIMRVKSAVREPTRSYSPRIREFVQQDAADGEPFDSQIARLYVRCRDELGVRLTSSALADFIKEQRRSKTTPKVYVYGEQKQFHLNELEKIETVLLGIDGKLWHGLIRDTWLHLVAECGMQIPSSRPLCVLFQCGTCIINQSASVADRVEVTDVKVQAAAYQRALHSLRLVKDVASRNYDQVWLYHPQDMEGLTYGEIPTPSLQLKDTTMPVTNRSLGPSEERIAIDTLLDFCVVHPRAPRGVMHLRYDPLKAQIRNAWKKAFPNGYEWNATRSQEIHLNETRLDRLVRRWRNKRPNNTPCRLTELGQDGWLSDQVLQLLATLLKDGRSKGLVKKGEEVAYLRRQPLDVDFAWKSKGDSKASEGEGQPQKPKMMIDDFFSKVPKQKATPRQTTSKEAKVEMSDSEDDNVPLKKNARVTEEEDVVRPVSKRIRR